MESTTVLILLLGGMLFTCSLSVSATSSEVTTVPEQGTGACEIEPTYPESAELPVADPESEKPMQVKKMDMDDLEKRLRKTKALGIFTKLELRNQFKRLIKDFDDYHQNQSKLSLDQLKDRFGTMMMTLITLLQNKDPELHQDIVDARPTFWDTLINPDNFSELRGR